jgi:hypothetical protein
VGCGRSRAETRGEMQDNFKETCILCMKTDNSIYFPHTLDPSHAVEKIAAQVLENLNSTVNMVRHLGEAALRLNA